VFYLSAAFNKEFYVIFLGFSDNRMINFWWRAIVLAPLTILVLRGCDCPRPAPQLACHLDCRPEPP
jgi:hypothetical protein